MNLCMKNYIAEYIRQCEKSMGSQMSKFDGYFVWTKTNLQNFSQNNIIMEEVTTLKCKDFR